MNILKILGGRKMAVAVGMVTIGVGSVLYVGDVPAGLLDLLKYTGGFLIGGNVVAKFAGSVGKAAPPAASPSDIAKLLESQQALGQGVTVVQDGLTYIINRMNTPAQGGPQK